MKISSSVTFVICILVLAAGFVWATFFPGSPYGVFAPSVVALAGAYFTKRVVQKNKNFNGYHHGDGRDNSINYGAEE